MVQVNTIVIIHRTNKKRLKEVEKIETVENRSPILFAILQDKISVLLRPFTFISYSEDSAILFCGTGIIAIGGTRGNRRSSRACRFHACAAILRSAGIEA